MDDNPSGSEKRRITMTMKQIRKMSGKDIDRKIGFAKWVMSRGQFNGVKEDLIRMEEDLARRKS